MNQKLKKFALDAGFSMTRKNEITVSNLDCNGIPEPISDELTEFASLIIEDAIQYIAAEQHSVVELWLAKSRNHITWELRRHFGFE